MTIAELAELEKKAKTVTTGSKKLDEILGGGIHTQEVTEVCGPYATGKSELVYTTAVFSLDALKGSAIILDTEATLKAGRILEIAEARDLDPKVVAERISMLQCLSSAALITALESLHKQVKENNVRFLAVDSLVSPFRREYPGRELLAARQQKLNYCIGLLLKYAWTYNLAALVTNQVMAKPEAQFVPASMPEKERPPIGGFVLSHGVNTRIYLKDTAVPNRSVATIIDSSYLPRESCVIRITKRGIDDVEEKTAKKEDETVKKDAEASVNRV
jgi:DNA repair protein RadA